MVLHSRLDRDSLIAKVRGNSRKWKYRRKFRWYLLLIAFAICFSVISWTLLFILHCQKTSQQIQLPSTLLPVIQNSRKTTPSVKVFHQTSQHLKHHCNIDEDDVVGMEGFAPLDYQLIQAHVFLSPGTDVPIKQPRSSKLTQTKSDDIATVSQKHEKGGPTYLQEFHQEISSLPELHSNFHHQHHQFYHSDDAHASTRYHHVLQQNLRQGKHFHNVYLKKWRLEGSRIKAKHFVFSSEPSFEAFSSLIANVFTFLPRKHFRNLRSTDFRVHPLIGNISSFHGLKNGSGLLDRYLSTALTGETELQSIVKELGSIFHSTSLFSFLSNVCLESVREPAFIAQFLSKLNLEHNLKLSLYKFVKNLPQDADLLHTSDIVMFPYLQSLISKLHKAERSFEKVFVHSADIQHIYFLLFALRLPLSSLPRLGSRVVFELYKSTSIKSAYFIRVLYNGEDVTQAIPLCNTRSNDALCKLKYFADYHILKHKSLQSHGYL